jgi:hypothetical protein
LTCTPRAGGNDTADWGSGLKPAAERVVGEIHVQPDNLELTAAGGDVIERDQSFVIHHSIFGLSKVATDQRMRDAAKLLRLVPFPA